MMRGSSQHHSAAHPEATAEIDGNLNLTCLSLRSLCSLEVLNTL